MLPCKKGLTETERVRYWSCAKFHPELRSRSHSFVWLILRISLLHQYPRFFGMG